MRLSAGELMRYRAALADVASAASDNVYAAISATDPRSGVATVREAAIGAIMETVGVHGDAAQAVAAQLFDEVCDAEGIQNRGFELCNDIIDYEMLEEKVHYFAKALVEGDGAKFLKDCSELAGFYARRCNWESMVRNCRRSHVRYARVPTGAETCEYCIMLASRGFVYWSKESAEHANHMHCDCVVVPGNRSTTIDGYDPDALYRKWKDGDFKPSSHGGSGGDIRLKASERLRAMSAIIGQLRGAKDMRELQSRVDAANDALSRLRLGKSELDAIRSAMHERRRELTGGS